MKADIKYNSFVNDLVNGKAKHSKHWTRSHFYVNKSKPHIFTSIDNTVTGFGKKM